ncbi:MAG: hypothetical protein ACXWQQ_11655 [Pseudobdellovibrio sp.]
MDLLTDTQKAPEEKLGMFALYLNRRDADMAIKALTRNGYSSEDISLLAPSRGGAHNYVYEQQMHVIQGAVVGAVLGMVLLGFGGFFISQRGIFINTNNFGVPQTDSTMLITITGLFFGFVLGAATGALAGIGIPQTAPKRYGFYLKEGGIVLVVHLRKTMDRLLLNRILEKTQGTDIRVLNEDEIWSTIIPEKKKLLQSEFN